MINDIKRLIANMIRQGASSFRRLTTEMRQGGLKKEVRKCIRESDTEWTPTPKVFGIGLSRTGTSSLRRALEILGYKKSLHWKRNGKVISWPEFLYADAATDISCSVQFETLYYAFEKSKFIYTVRDFDTWKQSIRSHLESKYMREFEHPGELRKVRTRDSFWKRHVSGWQFHNAIQGIMAHEALYAQYDSWEEAYHAFDSRVRRFFGDKPDDKFLEMNITGEDGWSVLCSFLGHDTPNQPFPHINKTGRDVAS